MALVYEAIGRLVVAVVSRKYRDELRLVGMGALVIAASAILLGLRGTATGPARESRSGLTRPGTRRKRRAGAFVSIR